jgi:hypothetical protein
MSQGMHYSLSLATGAFTGPLRGAMSALGGLTGSLSKIGNITTGISSMRGALDTLVSPFTKPVTLAGDMESLETSFRALLKNGPAAKSMVADLMQFADATPFNPEPVAQAGKQLLAFGFAAKSIKPLLSDIGDLAAGMGRPIDEVADAFGRLQSGQFGEAFQSLRRFGITMKDLEEQGLEFDKGGSFRGSTDKAVEAVRAIIRTKFGGGMEELSKTFQGKVSTMQGYWAALQRSLGEPIMESLKPGIEDAIKEFQRLTPVGKEIGKKIGDSLSGALHAFNDGDMRTLSSRFGSAFESLGNTIKGVLLDSFSEPIAYFQASIQRAIMEAQAFKPGATSIADEMITRGQLAAKTALRDKTQGLADSIDTSGDPRGIGHGGNIFNKGILENLAAAYGRDVEKLTQTLEDIRAKREASLPSIEQLKKEIMAQGVEVQTFSGQKSAEDFRKEARKFVPAAAPTPTPSSQEDKEHGMWSIRSIIPSDKAAQLSFADLALNLQEAIKAMGNLFGRSGQTQGGSLFSYSGVQERTDAALSRGSLDPAKIGNFLTPPADRRDNSDLAEAIALRITSNGAFESLVRDVAAIARPQPGDLAAQF